MPDNRTEQEKELGRLIYDMAMTNVDKNSSGFPNDPNLTEEEYDCLQMVLQECGVHMPADVQDVEGWLQELLNSDNPTPEGVCVKDQYYVYCVTPVGGEGCDPMLSCSPEINLGSARALNALVANYLDSREAQRAAKVHAILTATSLWNDKWFVNIEVTFNDYFYTTIQEDLLPSVDWWTGGPIFNKAFKLYGECAFGPNLSDDQAAWQLHMRDLRKDEAHNAEQKALAALNGVNLFNAETGKLADTPIFHIPVNTETGNFGLQAHFGTQTNQQTTSMGETVDGLLNEEDDPNSAWNKANDHCCPSQWWCMDLTVKNDTARRKERELENDKHNMEKKNVVEAFLLPGERDANIDALKNDNDKTSPNVEIDPVARAAELTAAAAGIPFFGKPATPLTDSQQLIQILDTMGTGGVTNPYTVTFDTNGNVTHCTGKLLKKNVTFYAGAGGVSKDICEAATHKIIDDCFRPWADRVKTLNFYNKNHPDYLKFTNGQNWMQPPHMGEVIIVENGIKTPFTILDGDITKLAAKLQGIREKTIAEAAAALAETELGNIIFDANDANPLGLPNEEIDLNELFNELDKKLSSGPGETRGRLETHPNIKKSPQAVVQKITGTNQGTGNCLKPDAGGCLDSRVRVASQMTGAPGDRVYDMELQNAENVTEAERARITAADQEVRLKTTLRGDAKPPGISPAGKQTEEAARCRIHATVKAEEAALNAAVAPGGAHAGDMVYKSVMTKKLRQIARDLWQVPIMFFGGWLVADYLAQKKVSAAMMSEAAGINRLIKDVDRYDLETEKAVSTRIEDYLSTHPAAACSKGSCDTYFSYEYCTSCWSCTDSCGYPTAGECIPSLGTCPHARTSELLKTCKTKFLQNIYDTGCVQDADDQLWYWGVNIPTKKTPSGEPYNHYEDFWNSGFLIPRD